MTVIWSNDLDLIKPKIDVKTDRDNEFSDRNVDFSRLEGETARWKPLSLSLSLGELTLQ